MKTTYSTKKAAVRQLRLRRRKRAGFVHVKLELSPDAVAAVAKAQVLPCGEGQGPFRDQASLRRFPDQGAAAGAKFAGDIRGL